MIYCLCGRELTSLVFCLLTYDGSRKKGRRVHSQRANTKVLCRRADEPRVVVLSRTARARFFRLLRLPTDDDPISGTRTSQCMRNTSALQIAFITAGYPDRRKDGRTNDRRFHQSSRCPMFTFDLFILVLTMLFWTDNREESRDATTQGTTVVKRLV